jgi:hypothetical protein
MTPFLEYLFKNKEWIFDGVGLFAISGFFFAVRQLFIRRRGSNRREPERIHRATEDEVSIPSGWHGMIPPKSKYRFYSKTRNYAFIGAQSFSFEYGPEGHVYPLNLKGVLVRADIQFSCRIGDLDKAFSGSEEFGLNVVQPKFLTRARAVMERYSVTRLRAKRLEVAEEIVALASPDFENAGFLLESVTIGSLEALGKQKA